MKEEEKNQTTLGIQDTFKEISTFKILSGCDLSVDIFLLQFFFLKIKVKNVLQMRPYCLVLFPVNLRGHQRKVFKDILRNAFIFDLAS